MSLYKKFASNKAMKDLIKPKEDPEYISTGVIPLNILFSGMVRGGIPKGKMCMFAAPSQSAKTTTALYTLRNAQKSGMECIIIDAENRFDFKWAESLGIDISEDKLLVVRTGNIIEIGQTIQVLKEGKNRSERENVFVLVDSWGTIVSPTTLDKAEKGSDTKNMSEAIWKNNLANLITESGMTYFVLNHVYDNVGGYGEMLLIGGGRRIYFNADCCVMCTGKTKDKATDGDVEGYILKANAHKGTKAIPKLSMEYRLKFKGGLDPWYGILNDALECKCVVREGNYYIRPDVDDTKWKLKDIYCNDFWIPIFKKTNFEEYLDSKYSAVTEDAEEDKIDISDLLEM